MGFFSGKPKDELPKLTDGEKAEVEEIARTVNEMHDDFDNGTPPPVE